MTKETLKGNDSVVLSTSQYTPEMVYGILRETEATPKNNACPHNHEEMIARATSLGESSKNEFMEFIERAAKKVSIDGNGI